MLVCGSRLTPHKRADLKSTIMRHRLKEKACRFLFLQAKKEKSNIKEQKTRTKDENKPRKSRFLAALSL